MRFKSEKCWSKSSSLAGAALFLAAPAGATLTVTPVNPGSGGVALDNVANNVAYYPANSALAIDSSDVTVPWRWVDLNATQGQLNSDTLIRFNVSSDQAITVQGSQVPVISVFTTGPNGQSKPVPIAFVNGSPNLAGGSFCNDSLCQYAPASIQDSSGNKFYLAAKYTPQTTLQIGIYPRDICDFYYRAAWTVTSSSNGSTTTSTQYNSGTAAQGCSNSEVNARTSLSTTSMQLTFSVNVAQDASSGPQTATTAAGGTLGKDDHALNLYFEDQAPTPSAFACPSDKSKLVFPGDGRVYFDTTGFALSPVPNGNTGLARVVAIGSNGGTPSLTNFAASSPPVARIPAGQTGYEVGGFANTTNGSDNKYNFVFLGRDQAGVLIGDGSCKIDGVQSSEIQGFLKESKCFIATAAFQSGRAAPVMVLRQFRDHVLLHTGAGRHFVNWYYRWSPSAADWLIANPEFRYPVIAALLPLVALSWVVLHPLAIAAVGVFWAMLAAFLVGRRVREGRLS